TSRPPPNGRCGCSMGASPASASTTRSACERAKGERTNVAATLVHGAARGGEVNWLDTVRTGLEAIRTHRLRSGLTMLGILIGIAAVILTVGLGEGAQAQVRDQINALGTNLLIVSPGSSTSSTGIRGGFGSASTLTKADADALASKVTAPDIAAVAPTTSSNATLVAGSTNWTTSVVGTTPSWLEVRARTLDSGRFI